MKNDSQFLKNGNNRCVVSSLKTIRLLPLIFFVIISQLSFGQLPQFYDFESGTQGWNVTNPNAGRSANTIYACSGDHTLFSVRNNNNNVFSPIIDLTPYSAVDISWCHQSARIENGEGFQLLFFNGTGYEVVRTFRRGTDFTGTGPGIQNNFTETLTINDYNFPPNARFRFRSLNSRNDEFNFFDNVNITVSPPCTEPTAQPTNIQFNSVTETTMNMNFTDASSVPDGYLVVINTTGITPTLVDGTAYPPGTTFGGNTVLSNDLNTIFNISGLSENTTYYFFIFSFNSRCSGGPDYNTNNPLTGIQATPAFCSLSFANGTSDVGCPSVDTGGLGLSGSDVPPINCSSPSASATLEATYLDIGDTSSYNVESIPFAPPFQFGCLENPVSVNIDDRWSNVIDLPFDFCFYGNTYSSCVIGSNGVISFDTGLAGNFSGWSISNDIPSNNNASGRFYGPSIFGVHHDVDPSVGGEIGYQLINLDSGCRALVASWFRVPMYANNNLLYTGMIVFYEETNIIEVYIDEKNIDGTWNGGRAGIGLQADRNTATTIPNRNHLDAPWTARQEAWRFVPSGTSITDLRWYENAIAPGNEIIDPDDDGQITVNPLSTTTYFAEVTYTLCNGTTIVESDATTVTLTGGKTWDGSESSNWSDPDNWTPVGVPTTSDCILIPNTANDPIMGTSLAGVGFNLEIEDGATLTQLANSSLTIEDRIVIGNTGDFEIQDDASVIQITDVVTNQNTGTARFQREVTGVDYFDYVYWSSPVAAFNLEDISPGTPAFAMYEWTPTTVNGTAGNHGNWLNTSGNMSVGQGYIVRGLLGGALANTAEFQGVLNNGQISVPISRGSYMGADYPGLGNTATAEDDNWNLLGNPYPSSISLSDFTAANPDIDGTLYFWRHLTPTSDVIADPFFEDYVYNYSASDYLTANSLGSTPPGHNGFIAAGQGFFALMLDSAPTTSTVVFNNTMRGTYDNSGFYRPNSVTTSNRHRIWLDFVNNSNSSANSILVGYINGATNGIDRLYDGYSINDSSQQFYSWITDEKLAINGRPLPFDDTDIVNLGFEAPESGNYSITINALDGLFSETNQTIYLEDKTLDIIHDLRLNPYSFTSEAGRFDERFVLRFSTEALSTPDEQLVDALSIFKIRDDISVESTQAAITSFELIDMQGRIIHKNFSLNTMSFNYNTQGLSRGTYLVRVALNNGSTQVKKLII